MHRVCFTVNVDWFFASHRLPLAEALLARGTDVHLLTSRTDAAADLEARGITVHDVAFSRRGRSPLELVRLGWRLRGLYRRLQPDLIHHVTVKPVLVGSAASRLAGASIPVVNAISGFGHLLSDPEAGRVAPFVTTQAYRAALRAPRRSRVIFQNQAALQDFVDRRIVRRGDARLIPGMGVDPQDFHPPSGEPSRPVVMLVGRMIRSKGIGEFVAAATQTRRAFPDARCVLVGPTDDGNPLAYDEQDLRALEAAGTVEYWGATTDVAGAMRQASVLVFPTYHEGLPKTLLEGAATGRAIVATDIPGCREVITAGHDGVLVAVRDADALAAAVIGLLEDPDERARLGAAARTTVLQRFTVDEIVRQHLDLYDEVVG